MTTAQADTDTQTQRRDAPTSGTGLMIPGAPQADSKFGGPRDENEAEQAQTKARHNQLAIEELEKLWGKKIHDYYLDHVTGVQHHQTKFGIMHSVRLDNDHAMCYLHDAQENVRYFGFWGHQPAFTQEQAKEVIYAAMSAGLKGGELFGPEEHKEMMWLEAQMVGFETDFTPRETSAIWQQLADRRAEADMTTAEPEVDAWLSREISAMKSVSGADAEKAAAVSNVLETIQDTFRDKTAQMTHDQQRTFMQTQQKSSWKDALQYYNDNSAVNGDAFSSRARAKTQGFAAEGAGFESKFSGAQQTTAAHNNGGREQRQSRIMQLKT